MNCCSSKKATIIKFKPLNKNAQIPIKAFVTDAGADLKSVANLTILPGRHAIVPTGLAIEMPEGWEAQIRSRSGLAAKKQIFVLNSPGTIDANYRGEIGVILQNLGTEPFVINIGDKIAQIVLKQVPLVEFVEVDALAETDRGQGGFGSTGIK